MHDLSKENTLFISIDVVLDVGPFRLDLLVSLDGTCAARPTTPVPDADCPSDMAMLCNGIKDCDDCADEDYDTCMAYDCIGGEMLFLPKVHTSMMYTYKTCKGFA